MDVDEVRHVSHAVFGNGYLVEVGAAIATHPKLQVTQKAIVAATSLDKGLVNVAVGRLEKGRLLQRLPREGREQPFLRVESVLWQAFVDFQDELRRA